MTKKNNTVTIPKILAELGEIEQFFKQPNLDLTQAMQKHQRAVELTKLIKTKLDAVEQDLEKIDMSGLVKSSLDLEK